jgi:hypothetical protein
MQPAWAFICQIATKTCTFFLSLRPVGEVFVGFRVPTPQKTGDLRRQNRRTVSGPCVLDSTAKIEIAIGSLEFGNHNRRPRTDRLRIATQRALAPH